MTDAGGFSAQSGSERRAQRRNVERCRKCQARLWFGPQPSGGLSDEAICAGLVGAANLKIAAPTGGRGNRPYQKDEYRWAKKRRALTRQKQQKQNASHRIAITVQQLLIRLTDYTSYLDLFHSFKCDARIYDILTA